MNDLRTWVQISHRVGVPLSYLVRPHDLASWERKADSDTLHNEREMSPRGASTGTFPLLAQKGLPFLLYVVADSTFDSHDPAPTRGKHKVYPASSGVVGRLGEKCGLVLGLRKRSPYRNKPDVSPKQNSKDSFLLSKAT